VFPLVVQVFPAVPCTCFFFCLMHAIWLRNLFFWKSNKNLCKMKI